MSLGKVFANKTSHFVASWYPPSGGDLAKLESQLLSFKSQFEKIMDIHKGNKPPSVHILGDFNFSDIVWQDRLNKSGSPLSLSEPSRAITNRSEHMFKRSSEMHIGSIFPISSLLIRIALIPIVPKKMRRRKSFGHLSSPSSKTRLGSIHSEKMEF